VSALTEKIGKSLSGLIEGLGYKIVLVSLFTRGSGKTLQIMIERLDGEPVSIDDCEKASKYASVSLDVSDHIKGPYTLEVSSTGVNRPLVSPDDFSRFCGKAVVVNTYASKMGRKTFKGILELANEYGIKVLLDSPLSSGEAVVDLLYEEVCSAHIDGFKN
jgi:ribosome maturation factor RimP